MKSRLLAAAFALVLAIAVSAPGQAQEDAPDAPEVIFTSPAEGQTISEPAFAIQMCFAEPVNILDLDKGGDFEFHVTPPGGTGLGLRIVFQPDGYGAAIYANNADAETVEGEWTMEYRLTTPDTLTPTEDILTYSVDPAGDDLPQATPPPCIPGETPQTVEGLDDGPTTVDEGGDSDDAEIVIIALIGVAAVSALALIGGLIYVARRRPES